MARNTNHPIYKERGKMNRQIGIVLIAFVVLVMVATIARLGGTSTGSSETNISTSEASE